MVMVRVRARVRVRVRARANPNPNPTLNPNPNQVRKICELTLAYARQHLRGLGHAPLSEQMTSYRGGLTALERRRIERQLYDGTLRAVTATSTLELGVDIARLELTLTLN